MEGQVAVEEEKEDNSTCPYRAERLLVEGDLIKYTGNGRGIGVYVSQEAITAENNYFELNILNTDMFGAVSIGVCHVSYPLNKMPGWDKGSLGYHGDDGMLFRGNALGYRFGPRCGRGDRMGCGVRPVPLQDRENMLLPALTQQTRYVYFTRNGKEIGCVTMVMPQGGLYPCVGLAGPQDMVRLAGPFPPPSSGPVIMSPHSPPPDPPLEDTPMAVDQNDDDWGRLLRIKSNGQCLTYSNVGHRGQDIGQAIARHPLSPAWHYFQLQILEPGSHVYITIGVTKKKYPYHSHPGWKPGSVAYHADDGKVFTGGNPRKGTLFGPPCTRGDVMGCGILFPRDYVPPPNSVTGCEYSSGEDDFSDTVKLSDNRSRDYCESSDDEGAPENFRVVEEPPPQGEEEEEEEDEDEEEEDEEEEYEEEEEEHDYSFSPGDALSTPRNLRDVGSASPDTPQVMLKKLLDFEGGEDTEEGEEEEEGKRRGDGVRVVRRPAPARSNSNRKRSGARKGSNWRMKGTTQSNRFINRNSVLIKEEKYFEFGADQREGPYVQVFFTRNGALLGRVEALVPLGGFFPTVSMGGENESILVDLRPLSG